MHKTEDRTTGQAVYDSVSPLHSLSTRLAERDRDEGRRQAGRRRRRDSDSDDEDEDEDRDERIPVPPIPDLRYEQGVLASIRPFLHRIDDARGGTGGAETEKEKKVATAERTALASAQLTAEGSSSSKREVAAAASDVLMAPLRIEWSKVTYVIVRDQVRPPSPPLSFARPSARG